MNASIQTISTHNRLIVPRSASEILGVTIETLAVWRSTGRYDLPYVKVGRKVMYRLEDIQSFIEKRTRTHTDCVAR